MVLKGFDIATSSFGMIQGAPKTLWIAVNAVRGQPAHLISVEEALRRELAEE